MPVNLFEQLAANREKLNAQGIHTTIPLVKDAKGIGTDPDLGIARPTLAQTAAALLAAAEGSQIPQNTAPAATAHSTTVSGTVAGAPKLAIKFGPPGTGSGGTQPNVLAVPVQGQTGQTTPSQTGLRISLPTVQPQQSNTVQPQIIPPTAKALVVAAQPTKLSIQELLKVDTATFDRGKEAYTQDEVAQFKGSFQMLKDAITNPKLVGQAVKNIMVMMGANPHLCNIAMPEEVGLMVRGIRQSYGVTVAKKSAASEQRGKRALEDAKIDNLLGDFGNII